MVHVITNLQITPAVSRFRVVASQVTACMSSYLLLLDIGTSISFVTIAMSNLLDPTQELYLNEDQASWFGSLSYLTQPLGALLSGPIVDYFGRKSATLLVNIPHLIAWIMLYFSYNVPMVFIANGLLGFGTGVMEAPINSYVGEISEPKIRGALCTATQIFTSVGMFLMFFLGTVVHWRVAALICVFTPVASMFFALLMPETPDWLLSRGKEKEALKSLCYLRGWTTPDQVREEFDKLAIHINKLQCCVICYYTNESSQECRHTQMNWFKRSLLKFRYTMLSKETLRPWILVMLYFTFFVMSGLGPVRANMVNICGAFGMPYDGRNIVLMVGVITLVSGVLVVGLIKILGKRKLAISSMLGTGICAMGLSIFAKNNLEDSINSYDPSTFPKHMSYVPLVLFYGLAACTGFGVPWVLLGEVFPFRSRGAAQGIAAAGNYVIMFIGTKTYINLETSTQLWGTFAVYALFGYLGTIYLYFFLPETEGKSLQEIESFYSGELKTFADDPFINFFKKFKRKT